MDEPKQLRVLHFRAENVLGLEVVEFDPDKNCVIVGGKNRQGKSCVLECLLMGLGGAKHVPPVPIRRGAMSGSIELDLGPEIRCECCRGVGRVDESLGGAPRSGWVTCPDCNGAGTWKEVRFRVRRSFTGSGTQLVVASADGARFQSPQAMLDELCGTLTLDPIGFAGMEPKKQRELLLKLVGVDLAESDSRLAAARAMRAGAIVARNDRRRELQTHEEPRAEVPDEETQTRVLLTEYDNASQDHVALAAVQRERDDAREAVGVAKKLVNQIEELAKQAQAKCNQIHEEAGDTIRLLREKEAVRVADLSQEHAKHAERIVDGFAAAEARLVEAAKAVDSRPAVQDLEEIKARIAKVDETNALVRAKKSYQTAQKMAGVATKEVHLAEQAVKKVEAERSALLSGAEFPVEGLDFSPDGVLYNGLPLEQEADSKLLEISLRVAMAQEPDIRVIRSKRGNDLDSEQLQVIRDVTAGLGYQLWLEVIEDKGPQTLVIEAGKVARLPATVITGEDGVFTATSDVKADQPVALDQAENSAPPETSPQESPASSE